MITTNILGTDYSVELHDANDFTLEGLSGACYKYQKKILLKKPEYVIRGTTKEEQRMMFQETILHELVHAYAKETCTHYDDDENLVEWIAMLIPKISHSYNDIMRQIKENRVEDKS